MGQLVWSLEDEKWGHVIFFIPLTINRDSQVESSVLVIAGFFLFVTTFMGSESYFNQETYSNEKTKKNCSLRN